MSAVDTTAEESASSAPPSHTVTTRTSALSTIFTTSPVQIYGIPVSVVIVILTNKDIYPFKRVCYKALPQVEKIVFRGVEPSIDSGHGISEFMFKQKWPPLL